ncbi:MAG TPA: hypothetical protein EYQ18_11155 [Candidatus Handelsmanbacteria bacterium]|nr:hypothetical protein [Candidatus Handelsmanbacteria bacterium]
MLRPMDLQDNFSKAPLVAREQNIHQLRPTITQHNLAQQAAEEHIHNRSRIRESAEADEAQNRVDDHDRQPGQQQQKKRQQPDAVETKETPRPRIVGDGHIDITV